MHDVRKVVENSSWMTFRKKKSTIRIGVLFKQCVWPRCAPQATTISLFVCLPSLREMKRPNSRSVISDRIARCYYHSTRTFSHWHPVQVLTCISALRQTEYTCNTAAGARQQISWKSLTNAWLFQLKRCCVYVFMTAANFTVHDLEA